MSGPPLEPAMQTPLTPEAGGSPRSGALRLPALRRLRGWDAIVAASALVLALVGLALGIGWIVSDTTSTTSYTVATPLSAIELQLSSGSADIRGSDGPNVRVQRVDEHSFGHSARERQSLTAGVLTLASRCPRVVVGSCSAAYRLTVPESVAVTVRTTGGDVHFDGFRGSARIETRSGSVAVDAFCGFALSAASLSGNIRVATACAPKRLDLGSVSGDVTALVPPGRYQVSASSASGSRRVSGVMQSAVAPFRIDAHSRSGDVAIVAGL